jgi:hypothetical protein
MVVPPGRNAKSELKCLKLLEDRRTEKIPEEKENVKRSKEKT